MSGVDFSDEHLVRKWLSMTSVEARCVLTSRASLRLLPMISEDVSSSSRLAMLRAILTTIAWVTANDDEKWQLRQAADTASRSVASHANLLNTQDYNIANAISGTAHTIAAASGVVRNLETIKALKTLGVWQATRLELALTVDVELTRRVSIETPLWNANFISKEIETEHYEFARKLEKSPANWGFWHVWYLAMWEGRFTDWDLAHEVALISDEVWEAGAEAVAVEIERIKARRALEAEIAALKEQLKQTQAAEPAHNRLHNNPPEAIESQQLKSEITLIWELLEDTEREIAKPSPSPSALRAIADTLWEISLRIGNYCASLADIALRKSAEVIGETGTKALIAVLVTTTTAQNEGVKYVINAIWEFVKTLTAG